MALNFDETILLILFAQANGTAVTSAKLDKFDDELQDAFGEMLQETIAEEGLPSDVVTRSLVLGCRPHMPGNTAALQIRNACRYVASGKLAVAPLFLGGAAPAGGGTVAVVTKTKKKKKTN
jgi:hypothetical protein